MCTEDLTPTIGPMGCPVGAPKAVVEGVGVGRLPKCGGLEVPAGLDGTAEGAVGLLFLVLELDLGVVDADLVGGHDVGVAAAPGLKSMEASR